MEEPYVAWCSEDDEGEERVKVYPEVIRAQGEVVRPQDSSPLASAPGNIKDAYEGSFVALLGGVMLIRTCVIFE